MSSLRVSLLLCAIGALLSLTGCEGPCPSGASFASADCPDPYPRDMDDNHWDDGYNPPPCPGYSSAQSPYFLSPCPDFGPVDFGVDFGYTPDMPADMMVDLMGEPRFEWVRAGGGPGNEDEIDAVASDSQGNVYISGKFEGSMTINSQRLTSRGEADIFVVSYDRAGNFRWLEQFGAEGEDNIYDAVCDAQDNLILSGQFSGTVKFGEDTLTSKGLSDIVVMKMTPDRSVLWARGFGTRMFDGGNEVSVDSEDHIIFGSGTGLPTDLIGDDLVVESPHFDEPLRFAHAGFQDAYLFKLDPQGDALWVRRLAGQGNDRAKSIAITVQDDILFGGDFEASATLEGDGSSHELQSVGGADAWTSRWTSQGDHIWHTSWGGPGEDLAKGAARALDGGHYVVGSFERRATFGAPQASGEALVLESGGGQDLFLLKRDANNELEWVRHLDSTRDVQGAELEAIDGGGVVFGCSLNANTRVDASDQDIIEVAVATQATIQPMLVRYDERGQLVSHTLLEGVNNGRFDELSLSGKQVFIDLVYRSDDMSNAIQGVTLDAFGQKDFALVSYTLP